ncbi:hypothetical protein Salat_0221500 [Sesamum alatum]|uniref:Uncharacterized protein n=1 Tax=Sesamum alatum TaxID=300844 RepID=A0AAE1YYL7_9LAMI|nr:hypothetical protein Salat_0221500 [Sesamum alatum]
MASSEALAMISGTASSLTIEVVRKLAAEIALQGEYYWVVPSPNQSANNPPLGYLTVYSAQLTSGLRFPLPDLLIQIFNVLGIPPSQLLPNSYRRIVDFLLCAQLYEFDPSVENFLGVFSPKITSGECSGYPCGPRAPCWNSFVFEAFTTRPARRPSGRSHAPCWYFLVLSALYEPFLFLSSSLKRPRREETSSEGTPRSYEEAPGLIFPASVLTPRLDPRAGSFNMRQATHHSDVETLSLRSMQGLGSFILAQASTIAPAVMAMTEKYMVLMKNWESLRKELADTRAKLDCLQNQYRDNGARSREREARLVDELEALRVQLVEKDGQIAALTLENEVVRASTVQAYTRGCEEGASSAVAAFKKFS